MIYIPKYKDIYITNGEIAIKNSFKGEYRAILRGIDGRIKYESGWQSNTILNRGLLILTTPTNGTFDRMHLGTSDIAIDVTQIGLQGSDLGSHSSRGALSSSNSGTPNYEHISTIRFVFNPGTGTGLIKEFVILETGVFNPLTQAVVRIVLTTPINKGVLDELTIDHRLTWYPEINDVSGSIDISGTSYNYVMRHTSIDLLTDHLINLSPGGSHNLLFDTPLVANTLYPTGSSISSTSLVNTNGGVAPNYWAQAECIYDVDKGPGNVSLAFVPLHGTFIASSVGIQYSLDKTTGGGPLVKTDTHELRLNVRSYPIRHV